MIGWATNCEMLESSAGAVDGRKPSEASLLAIACEPGTAPLAGTAGWLPGGRV